MRSREVSTKMVIRNTLRAWALGLAVSSVFLAWKVQCVKYKHVKSGAIQLNPKLDQAKNIFINRTLPVDSHDTPRALEAGGTLRPIGKRTRKQFRKKEEDSVSLGETKQKQDHVFGISAQAKAKHLSKQTCADKAESQKASYASKVEQCGMRSFENKSLLFLTSSGNDDKIKLAFDELVEKLLENKKLAGETKTKKDLNVLALYDSCMLYESFWNPEHVYQQEDPSFSVTMTSDKLTDPPDQAEKLQRERSKKRDVVLDLAKERAVESQKYTGILRPDLIDILSQWYCQDERKLENGFADVDGQGPGGFGSFAAISIIDRMMTSKEFEVLLKIRADKLSKPDVDAKIQVGSWDDFYDREIPEDIKKLIEDADIIVASDGQPDVAAFVWQYFKQVKNLVRDKIRAGKMIYWGREAGSNGASADFHLTSAIPANIVDTLLVRMQGNEGLVLTAKCAVTTGYSPMGWIGWQEDLVSVFEEKTGLHVARVGPGQALQCVDSCCFLIGSVNRVNDVNRVSNEAHLEILRTFKTIGNIQEVLGDAKMRLEVQNSEREQERQENQYFKEQEDEEREREREIEAMEAAAATSENEANGEDGTQEKDKSMARNSLPPKLILVALLASGVHVGF